jgi:hypothetical protein
MQTVQVSSGTSTGLLLNLEPSERIQAVDTDSAAAAGNNNKKVQIRYSLIPASDFFEVHPVSGWIRQS